MCAVNVRSNLHDVGIFVVEQYRHALCAVITRPVYTLIESKCCFRLSIATRGGGGCLYQLLRQFHLFNLLIIKVGVAQQGRVPVCRVIFRAGLFNGKSQMRLGYCFGGDSPLGLSWTLYKIYSKNY